jgi:GMP synthase-like glutamine amidotransferase
MPRVSSDEVRGLVLQPQDTAPLGLLEGWAQEREIALEVLSAPDGGFPAPDARRYAFAIVLGASGSLARDVPDWTHEVLAWLRAADAACLPVLGICFGAQALAAALGGSVHRLVAPEIGWITVTTADADRVPAGPWMAWHEDGLVAPPLAYELASNAFGTQAFCLRRHLAVQFHPESTAEIVDGWAGFPDTRLGETGQTREGLRAEWAEHGPSAAVRATQLFDGFAERAGVRRVVAT